MASGSNTNGLAAPDAAQPQNGDSSHISADEIALYDRQIRLWGMKAQSKIRSANVLLIQMRSLANEVAKNLVLAGIGKLTIIDHAPVTPLDRGSQFFLPPSDDILGTNRAEACLPNLQKLNPRVSITVDTSDVRSKGPSFFSPFDIVVATDIWDPRTLTIINTATRSKGTPFYCSGVHGMYGYIFADLVEHSFVVERESSNKAVLPGRKESRTCTVVSVQRKKDTSLSSSTSAPESDGTTAGNNSNLSKNIELVTFHELYSTFLLSDAAKLPPEITSRRNRLRSVSPALPCLRALFEFAELNDGALPDKSSRQDIESFIRLSTRKKQALGLPQEMTSDFLRNFLQGVGTEVSPVSAILGGQLAQDVINVLGGTQQPIQNMLVYDGNKMEAPVYSLHPEGELGKDLLTWANNGIPVEAAVAAVTANGGSASSVVVPVSVSGTSGVPPPAGSATRHDFQASQVLPAVGGGQPGPGLELDSMIDAGANDAAATNDVGSSRKRRRLS
ncbi:putative sumo activating enzyme protein [Zalerion maritima]|uniref:Ubiquitin-like 1-activating enzyme E1A n=1 Tax=Zalerion maritima TaxID=339359 RepID=A0AAD5RPC3_9PEZI|nr:putative sumo activating enzyme protein [Zalerion maritima]